MAVPSDYSGLTLWLKADAISASDGSAISSWPDSSGNGNNATQSTASNQPVYRVNRVNSLPAVFFGNTQRIGMVTPLSVVIPYTLFVVYSTLSIFSYQRVLQGAANNWAIGPRPDVNGFHGLVNSASQFLRGLRFTANEYVRIGVTQDTGDCRFYQSSHLFDNNALAIVPGTLALGPSGAYDERINGYIAEVVVYNRVLTDGERAGIDAYLTAKYAIPDLNPIVAPATISAMPYYYDGGALSSEHFIVPAGFPAGVGLLDSPVDPPLFGGGGSGSGGEVSHVFIGS